MTPEESLRRIITLAGRTAEPINTAASSTAVIALVTLLIAEILDTAQQGLQSIPPKSKELITVARDPKASDDEFPWSAKIRDTSLVGYGETAEEALDALLDEIKVAETFRAKVLALAKGEGI